MTHGNGPASGGRDADFEARMIDRATGDAPDGATPDAGDISADDRVAAWLHEGLAPRDRMPGRVRSEITALGEAMIRAKAGGPTPVAPTARGWGLALAASLAVLVGTIAGGLWLMNAKNRSIASAQERLEALETKVSANESLLAEARARAEALALEVESGAGTIQTQRRDLGEAAAREVRLAERLASATGDLDRAMLEIARLEAPEDPAVLAQNRLRLLEVPDTIRVAWSPFDLPDAPAIVQGVTGDVVWNDELQQGYLRFVGLPVNDPSVQQYQVWVIDERGMEQKVSGGVFNATADGEVIVPIEPGIDVGRVALFAITVEDPGGTWVPDLSRRVVVAPRAAG